MSANVLQGNEKQMEEGEARRRRGTLAMEIKMKMKIQNEICTFSRMVGCPPEQICQLAKQNELTHTHTHTNSIPGKATKFAYHVRAVGKGRVGGALHIWEFLVAFGCSIKRDALCVSLSLAPFLLIITR